MIKDIKICLISSSGGHFNQLCKLIALKDKYDLKVITESTNYNSKDKRIDYYLHQINRKEFFFPMKFINNFLKSIVIFIKEKPDVVISTGALATIPMCYIASKCGKKVIFIESFAKISNPTKTGKFMYKIADRFYVQWEQMLSIYPNAIFVGGIY